MMLQEKNNISEGDLQAQSCDILDSCSLSQRLTVFLCLWVEICAVKWHYESVTELSSAECVAFLKQTGHVVALTVFNIKRHVVNHLKLRTEWTWSSITPPSGAGGKLRFSFYLTSRILVPTDSKIIRIQIDYIPKRHTYFHIFILKQKSLFIWLNVWRPVTNSWSSAPSCGQ